VSGRNVYVAGSVGPLGLSPDEAASRGIDRAQCFREQIRALLEAGVDAIFFETFMDYAEMEIAFQVKKELSALPEICSFACTREGRLSSGMELREAFRSLGEQGAKVVGVNCMNGPRETAQLLRHVPVEFHFAAFPAAGHPRYIDGELSYDTKPEDFAGPVREMVALGARLIGGCCGTTPDHIRAIATRLEQWLEPRGKPVSVTAERQTRA
jgi:homocysteine S-methyltransferase